MRAVPTVTTVKTEKRVLKRLGKRIHVLRNERRLTQERLGELLGVEQSVISKAERGETALSLRKLILLAEVFDLRVGELFYGI